MIARFSVRQPVLVHMLTLAALIGGFWAYKTITLESFPLMTTDIISVVSRYPSASPAEVEKLVTIPIEDRLKDLDIIDELRSSSIEGRSIVTVKLKASVEDLTKAHLDIQNRVNQVNLPDGLADEPNVIKLGREWSIMSLAISGGADYMVRKRKAEELRDRLKAIAGVSSVTLAGMRDREVWVELDPVRMTHYQLGLDEVVQAIRDRHINLPGGTVKEASEEVILRTVGEFRSTREIGEIVVAGVGAQRVRLSDIGQVRDTFEEPVTIGRSGGRRAITLSILKQETGNTIKIVDAIREFLKGYRAELPENMQVSVTRDGSKRIRRRLSVMLNNGAMGLVLVLFLLWIFLDFRIAVMAALGIAVSFFATVLFMKLLGTSLNMISMFGLIIVLGMLVDDTIVVVENIYRYMQMGLAPIQAAVRGATEVFWPVLAAVSTSMAAFLPLLMMYGMMGKFLRWIPITVTLALLASLVEAFFVLPSHMADFARPPVQKREKRWFKRLRSFYTFVLCRSIRYRYVVAFGVPLLTIALVAGGMKLLGFQMFPRTTLSGFTLKVKTPTGSSLLSTEQVVADVERLAMQLPRYEVEGIQGKVGEAGSRDKRELATHFGQVRVTLTDPDDRPQRSGDAIIAEIRRGLKRVRGAESVEFQRSWHGPSQAKAIEVRILGAKVETLQKLAAQVKAFLGQLKGVEEIQDDFDAGKSEARVRIDETLAKARGLDARRVARSIQIAYGGQVATQIQTGREEVDVRVRLAARYRKDTNQVQQLKFKGKGGLVPFSAFARLERGQGFSRINRFDGKRVVTVSADVDKKVTTSVKVNAALQAEFGVESKTQPGYQLAYGGQEQERSKSMKSLARAFVLALAIIYCILGCLFRSFIHPLVVMAVIPLGFMGVVYGLFVHGQPIGLMAIIGTIALSGVVVNDSLVFLDFINRLRQQGIGLHAAVVIAGRRRLRPILLTTITTILGLLPLVLEIGGSSSFLTPMAIAIVWGIGFATMLTLLVIPSLYLIVEDLRRLLGIKPGLHDEVELL